jgi:hypothetical protein
MLIIFDIAPSSAGQMSYSRNPFLTGHRRLGRLIWRDRCGTTAAALIGGIHRQIRQRSTCREAGPQASQSRWSPSPPVSPSWARRSAFSLSALGQSGAPANHTRINQKGREARAVCDSLSRGSLCAGATLSHDIAHQRHDRLSHERDYGCVGPTVANAAPISSAGRR